MLNLKRFREIVGNKSHKQIIENYFSLSILNGLNILLPLVTLPYLVRILGPEKYGTVSFVLVIIQYITLISNYGFTYSATKLISQNRDNIQKVSLFFSSIIHVKFIISICISIVLIVCVLNIPKLHNEYILYIMSAGIIFGDILNPTWLFQGMEKMKYMTLINFISKGSFTILTFFVITKVSDYPYVCLLTSIGYLLSGIFSMFLAFNIFKIKLVIPKRKDYLFQIKEGWYIFVSSLGMNLYRNTNIFILGIFTSDSVVGLYSAAEKVIRALQTPITPLSEALYPYFSNRFHKNSESDNISVLFRLGKYYLFALGILSLAVFFLSGYLTTIILGNKFIATSINIKIMSFVILFGGLNYLFGIIGLVNLNMKREFAIAVLIAGFTCISITGIFCRFYFEKAASFGMLASEMVLFVIILSNLMKMLNKESVT
ncbi:MAG TPA: flippase [Ignavibacteria bacterium]